ncbi:prolactin-releasing peptide [Ahaetulla prasina]|uniref:prolactin-releasing peptide n=1 Tax=Ahaetulla prasina TaxID=499056 RepID=UPI002649C10C|nr:prolactin-releasing peptide [Ahaetulla prasina]
MRLLVVCLLMLAFIPETKCRIFERFMEIRSKFPQPDPDIDPSWYTGRGIRPVGRFGRRRAAAENVQKSGNRHLQACFPVEESSESLQDE